MASPSLHMGGFSKRPATNSMDTAEAEKHSQHEAEPMGCWPWGAVPNGSGFPTISVAKSWVAARLRIMLN